MAKDFGRKPVAAQLIRARIRAGHSRRKVARSIGTNVQMLSNVEDGTVAGPNLYLIERLADYYGLSMEALRTS